MDLAPSQQQKVKEFTAVTGASRSDAIKALNRSKWNLETATAYFFDSPAAAAAAAPAPATATRGGRGPGQGMFAGVDAATEAAIRAAMDFDVETSSTATVGKASVVLVKTKFRGCTLQVRHGDLTKERADAVVNAANKMLQHAGGLARSLVNAGGSIIQQESKAYVRTRGVPNSYGHKYLPDSSVATTTAGSLPCRVLLHAVGPVWGGGPEVATCRAAVVLKKTVTNCMVEADKSRCKSIALPAISSGKFGFPRKLCAQVMLAACTEYLTSHTGSGIKRIAFTNFDTHTCDFFTAELRRKFGSAVKEGEAGDAADAGSGMTAAAAPAPAPAAAAAPGTSMTVAPVAVTTAAPSSAAEEEEALRRALAASMLES